MDLNKIINIKNLDIEKEIQNTINDIKEKYKDLTDKQTCRYYSSFVYDSLKNKGITSRLVDTSDLDSDYSHMFVLVPNIEDTYLIDLTYNQFTDNDEVLSDLKNNGYTLLSNEKWNHYLKILPKDNDFTIDDAIYGKEKKSL